MRHRGRLGVRLDTCATSWRCRRCHSIGARTGDASGLSGRELDVLRYLATHLSTREIALALHVSRNTVKSHMQHLYRKLGVGSRSAAVERARALQLLR